MANLHAMYKCEAAGCTKTATHEVFTKAGESIGKFCYPDAERKWQAQEKRERGIGKFAPYDGRLPPDHR